MPEVVKTRIGTVTYLAPNGPLTEAEHIGPLGEAVQECLQEKDIHLVIDLGRVAALNSAGLEALFDAYSKVSRLGGSVKVINANALVRDIFLITGLQDHITVVQN